MIQLTPEEADAYRKCPVVLDFNTGFYIFPVRPSVEPIVNAAHLDGLESTGHRQQCRQNGDSFGGVYPHKGQRVHPSHHFF